MKYENLALEALKRLGLFRVMVSGAIQFNSILFRIIVGIIGGLPAHSVAYIGFLEFFLNGIFEVPLGVFADRRGRVPIALCGLILFGASLICLFFAIEYSENVSLSLFFITLDGIMIGIGKAMYSGSVEAFYQDAIVRHSVEISGGESIAKNSFTISNQYARYVTTIFVTLAFVVVYYFPKTRFTHFSFLFGAGLYFLIAVKLFYDFRLLGDHPQPSLRNKSHKLLGRLITNPRAAFSAFLYVAWGIFSVSIMGYLIVSVGRETYRSGSEGYLVPLASFMFGYVSIGWIAKAYVLPRLVKTVRENRYPILLLGSALLLSLISNLLWKLNLLVSFSVVLFIYGVVTQVVFSGIKDFGTNLLLREFHAADFATSVSLCNFLAYVFMGAYHFYYLVFRKTGVPAVSELFMTMVIVCTIGCFLAACLLRPEVATTRVRLKMQMGS